MRAGAAPRPGRRATTCSSQPGDLRCEHGGRQIDRARRARPDPVVQQHRDPGWRTADQVAPGRHRLHTEPGRLSSPAREGFSVEPRHQSSRLFEILRGRVRVPALPESIVGRTRCGVVKWRIEPLASDRPTFAPRRARLLAFYLPQFHPVPENDEFWEPGFTEWTNVVRARPLFPGHRQPRLPGGLGFYDLRVAETRAEQARSGEERRHRGLRLLALLVRQRAPDPRAAVRRSPRQRRARLPLRPRLGEPVVDRHLARRTRPHADRAALPG